MPRTAALQAPLPVGSPGNNTMGGLPFPSAGCLPDPGLTLHWQVNSLPLSNQGSPQVTFTTPVIDKETVETVPDFTFWGSKITADGDCSMKLKDTYSSEGKI